MKIIGISGSLREESLNTSLLNACVQFIPDGNEFTLFTLENIPLYNEDIDNDNKPDEIVKFLELIRISDLVIFVSPEYNHGISGVLKNAIDWASRPAFNSPLRLKPCGLLTASKSPVGGARAQADLKNILSSTLSLVYPSVEYLLADAHEKINENGSVVDDTALRRLQRYMEELTVWASNQHPQNKGS